MLGCMACAAEAPAPPPSGATGRTCLGWQCSKGLTRQVHAMQLLSSGQAVQRSFVMLGLDAQTSRCCSFP